MTGEELVGLELSAGQDATVEQREAYLAHR